MKILSEHDRVAIVTIAMTTGKDIDKVATEYLEQMNRLEDWLITTYYRKEK